MIVLSEASTSLTPSPSMRDLLVSDQTAQLLGCRIYHIEQDFERCGDAVGALSHVPDQLSTQPGYWLGYIPSLERYHAIYKAALAKNIQLLNTPAEHQIAQEFDSAYPRIAHLTPASRFIRSDSECAQVGQELGFPLFVKGSVQSRKAKGWRACVAKNLGELEELTRTLLSLENRTRGRVVARKLARLRHSRKSAEGFPIGREYRVFLFKNEIVGLSYYWEGDDPLKPLLAAEGASVRNLAIEASTALAVPFVSIDIGQTESLEWLFIESGDGQFSGLSQVNRLGLWQNVITATGKAS